MADSGVIFECAEGAWLPTQHALGPWGETLHGGAPAALLAHAFAAAARPGFAAARISFDLIRPVPAAPLTVSVRELRSGRRIQLLEAEISAAGKGCVRATSLWNRADPVAGTPPDPSPSFPAAPEGAPLSLSDTFRRRPGEPADAAAPAVRRGLHTQLRVRPLEGFAGDGFGRGWLHLPLALAPGIPLSPLAHLAALADFANGVSQRRFTSDDQRYGFINADISLHVLRLPAAGWIAIDAQSIADPAGRALVRADYFDPEGLVARVIQTALVQGVAS